MQYVVSACLAGQNCRYDGKSNLFLPVYHLVQQGKALPVCPEELGGLPTPRIPCELCPACAGEPSYTPLQKSVLTKQGKNVTLAFINGAQRALALAQEAGCIMAIVKSRSPSCGAHEIYDGSFSKKLLAGQGIWAHMLMEAGFTVYTEETFISKIHPTT